MQRRASFQATTGHHVVVRLFVNFLLFISNRTSPCVTTAENIPRPPSAPAPRRADCPAGTFVYNDESCESCPSGTYAPQALADACLDCTAGFETRRNKGTLGTCIRYTW